MQPRADSVPQPTAKLKPHFRSTATHVLLYVARGGSGFQAAEPLEKISEFNNQQPGREKFNLPRCLWYVQTTYL